jgi:hypothetical protein
MLSCVSPQTFGVYGDPTRSDPLSSSLRCCCHVIVATARPPHGPRATRGGSGCALEFLVRYVPSNCPCIQLYDSYVVQHVQYVLQVC